MVINQDSMYYPIGCDKLRQMAPAVPAPTRMESALTQLSLSVKSSCMA